MRLGVFYLFIVCIFLATAFPARANVLEFLFPSLKKEQYNPYETLTAPFANDEASQKERAKEKLDDLSKPHRTQREIGNWLGMKTSDLLTFKADTYQQYLRDIEPSFSQDGLTAYTAFLQEHTIMKVLGTGQYDITTIKQGEPLLLNEGAIDGRYRWLFEVPVMISYIKRNITDYKNVTPVNRTYTIRLQLGRVQDVSQDVSNEHGLLIESFNGAAQ
jgi:hypothetical protein